MWETSMMTAAKDRADCCAMQQANITKENSWQTSEAGKDA